jgi:hypothetical protein
MNDLITTLDCHMPEVMQLRLRMLIEGRYPHIKGGAFHARRPFFCGVVDPCLAT